VAIHQDVAAAVDALLRGAPAPVEVRMRTADGRVERRRDAQGAAAPGSGRTRRDSGAWAAPGGVTLPGETLGGRDYLAGPAPSNRRQPRRQAGRERRHGRYDWIALDTEDGSSAAGGRLRSA
jgi:hypothetical protein